MITSAQIANATRGQLLQITYQLLLESMDDIKKHGEEKDEKNFGLEIARSRNIVQELIDTLDFKQEISNNLLQIYIYINGLLIKSLMAYKPEIIDEAQGLVNTLLEGWNGATEDESESLKVMNNAQQVYAGLTYGKDHLNESVVTEQDRGFKA